MGSGIEVLICLFGGAGGGGGREKVAIFVEILAI